MSFGLAAICFALVIETRQSALTRAIEAGKSVAAAVSFDIARTIESYDLSLQAVIDNRLQPGVAELTPELRHLLLFDRSASAPYLSSISFLDADGVVRIDSRAPNPAPTNRSDREHFQYHKAHTGNALYVSRPFTTRSSASYLVNISRRVDAPDGSFGGVISGAIKIAYFNDSFKKAMIGHDGNITLVRTDGIVLTRWPYRDEYVGLDIKHADIFKYLAQAKSGYFETTAKTDNVRRLIVYRQVGDLPLVIGVGQSLNDVYAAADRTAAFIVGVVLLLLLVVWGFVWKLVRELRQRADLQSNLHDALRQMSQGLSMYDEEQRLVVCNDKYLEVYALPKERVRPGISFQDILRLRKEVNSFNGDPDRLARTLVEHISRGESFTSTTETPSGRVMMAVSCPRVGGGWVSTHDDITERRKSEIELSGLKNFLASVIEHVPLPLAVKDPESKKFVLINQAYEDFMGEPREQIVGSTVFDYFDPDTAQAIARLDDEALEQPNHTVTGEFVLDTSPHGRRIVTTTRIVVRDNDGAATFLIAIIEDITSRREAEAQIAYLAHNDPLTGLANRSQFRERIDAGLAASRRYGSEFAVFIIDLDRFKAVNDTLGHHAGDELLCEVSRRMKDSIREVDFAARLGGDEFAVIVAPGERRLREGVVTLATRLLAEISAPYEIFGRTVSVGASIGIALAPQDSANAEELIRFADLAMYEVKNDGRDGFRFFSRDMEQDSQERLSLDGELRRAVAQGELELRYQPTIDSGSGIVVSAEALIQWNHPKKGYVGPDQFITHAEETGLILPIGEWALRTACRDALSWPADVKVSVNVSAVQCQRNDFGDSIIVALAETGLPPERLELEITEAALVHHSASTLAALQKLRELGVAIVMDDFGTRLSSLQHLQRFPFDKVKIDKSLVADLAKDQNSAAIVGAISALAKGLNVQTVAEGVDTERQYDLLRIAGCDEMQGSLFGEPGPVSQLRFGRALYTRKITNAA